MERPTLVVLESGPQTVSAIVKRLTKTKYLPRATEENILLALEGNPHLFSLDGDEWSLKKYASIYDHSLSL